MKKLSFLMALIIGVFIFESCKKDEVQIPDTKTIKPQNMDELVANPAFDWKTTKNFQFSISGKYNDVVTVKSKSGVIYHKGFMKTGTTYKLNITLPSTETIVQIIYHGQIAEIKLNQTVINYTFI